MHDFSEEDLFKKWHDLTFRLSKIFGKRPDLNGALFLIGVQELGKGNQVFSKEEKQDLMHIATCKLLEPLGYYLLDGLDEEGWPIWKNIQPLPNLQLKEQEKLLKIQVLDYFKDLI